MLSTAYLLGRIAIFEKINRFYAQINGSLIAPGTGYYSVQLRIIQ
jgi:hypothetical protein